MKKAIKFAESLGCLTSVAGPFLALILYPRAKWMFGLILLGFLILWLNARFAKDPTPDALADEIERLLTGNYSAWAVDNFEHQRIRDFRLRDLHGKCMAVGGLPEEWVKLDEERRDQISKIIRELRGMNNTAKGARSNLLSKGKILLSTRGKKPCN